MMMQLDNILHQLLLQHECVIIPGFGGFIVRESPCNFNNNKEIMKPYGKSVFFNPHLSENDGLLINAIVNTNHVSYTEASTLLEKWIESLNNNVAEIGKSVIHQLGVFYKGQDNGKWFTADANLNLALSSYGLRPVKSGIVNAEAVITEERQIEFKPLADNKPIETLEVPKRNWKAWAAAAAIALVAHIGYLAFEKKDNPVHSASVVPSISNNEVKPVETAPEVILTPEEEITPNANSEEQPVVNITPEEQTKTEPVAENKTEIVLPEVIVTEQSPIIQETTPEDVTVNTDKVIGKYKLEQNAFYHRKDLAKAGISATIRKNEQGLFEVIVSSPASN